MSSFVLFCCGGCDCGEPPKFSPSNSPTRPLLEGVGPLSNTPNKSPKLFPPVLCESGDATLAGVPPLIVSRAVGGDALAGAAPSKSISKRFSALAPLTPGAWTVVSLAFCCCSLWQQLVVIINWGCWIINYSMARFATASAPNRPCPMKVSGGLW